MPPVLSPLGLEQTELVQLITPILNTDLTPRSSEQRPRVLGLQAALPTAENMHDWSAGPTFPKNRVAGRTHEAGLVRDHQLQRPFGTPSSLANRSD